MKYNNRNYNKKINNFLIGFSLLSVRWKMSLSVLISHLEVSASNVHENRNACQVQKALSHMVFECEECPAAECQICEMHYEQIMNDSVVRKWLWQFIDAWNALLDGKCSGEVPSLLKFIRAGEKKTFLPVSFSWCPFSDWRYSQIICYNLDISKVASFYDMAIETIIYR